MTTLSKFIFRGNLENYERGGIKIVVRSQIHLRDSLLILSPQGSHHLFFVHLSFHLVIFKFKLGIE